MRHVRRDERVLITGAPAYPDVWIETERLVIRAWRLDDAEAAFTVYGDPEVVKHLTGVPEESVESQRETLGQIIRAYSALDMGLGSFAVATKSDGRLVGAVILKPLPRNEHLDTWRRFRTDPTAVPPVTEIEVGWHLRRDAWGKGYALESATAALDYGFSVLGLQEIYAVYDADNIRSQRVADRLGMCDLGTTDRFYGIDCCLRLADGPTWATSQDWKTSNSVRLLQRDPTP
jgi:RimJ/RimL family protein N-acetyltransferase